MYIFHFVDAFSIHLKHQHFEEMAKKHINILSNQHFLQWHVNAYLLLLITVLVSDMVKR